MAKQYDNELRGALFKNSRQREGKKDPEYQGQMTVQGVEYWLDGWVEESKAGQKYFSLKLRVKDEQRQQQSAPPNNDDDIPF